MRKTIAAIAAVLMFALLLGCEKDGQKIPTCSNIETATYSNITDTAQFDIDGDGVCESCTIRYGNTSGVYSIVICVSGDDNIKYESTFYPSSGQFSFYQNNGRLFIERTVTDSETGEATETYTGFSVQDGGIVIENEEEFFN